jgi:hypothetical protein
VKLTDEKLVKELAVSSWDSQLDARGQKKSPQQMPSGIRAAARDLGIDKNEAHRAQKIAGIKQEARTVADEAGLDTQAARLAIAKEPKSFLTL